MMYTFRVKTFFNAKEAFNMSILEELYNGNIAPIERSIKKGSEYYKLCKAAAEKKRSFLKN